MSKKVYDKQKNPQFVNELWIFLFIKFQITLYLNKS